MAELIHKEKPKTSPTVNFLFYLFLITLIILIFGSLILKQKVSTAQSEVKEIKEQIIKIEKDRDEILQKETLTLVNKIKYFPELLEVHKINSNFLKILENLTHPEVWLTKLTLNNKNSQVQLIGQTANLEVLGQQMQIFWQNENIKELKLTQIFFEKDGKVNFTLNFIADSKIFKK